MEPGQGSSPFVDSPDNARQEMQDGQLQNQKMVCDCRTEETRLAEVIQVVQGLQQGVHVAGGALVLQAHMARLLLGVVEVALKALQPDVNLDDDSVIQNEALRGARQLALGHELVEAPVILLHCEHVLGVCTTKL